MRTLTTVVMAGLLLALMAGCSSHEMMDKSMDTKRTSVEEPMNTMDATSDTMMKDNMAKDSMMKPAADPMTKTMQ